MTCPFYKRIEEKNVCEQYGEQSENKASEECHGNFEYCLRRARKQMLDEISGGNFPESIRAQRTEAINGKFLDNGKSFF
ncbi:MAG: hypothetical protein KJ879_01690 [Nanoarchaeota archaeon]|nr:hypothetical protein [Nanoarchaeota archaeon]